MRNVRSGDSLARSYTVPRMVLVLDYHMGNLANVCRVLKEVGAPKVRLDNDPRLLAKARAVVLPGVGAFGQAVENLESLGLLEPLREWTSEHPPLLGICLGMQLLFESSTEFGRHRGLSLLKGKVVRLPKGLKVPHMGWNELHLKQKHPLLKGVKEGDYAYFVHSYYVPVSAPEETLVTTDYGVEVLAIAGKGNVAGFQFHPEKSQQVGHKMLGNFFKWVGL